MTSTLPPYSDEFLAAQDADELVRLLIRNEDRAPRNLIDECARRGDEMIDRFEALLEKDYYWSQDQANGEWWLLFHAVMILGLIPDARAGALLIRFMRRMDEAGDETLEEWLGGYWPVLLQNKPDSYLGALRSLAQDPAAGWYTRVEAIGAVIARGHATGGAALDEALAWAARIAFADKEDLDVRVMTGSILLDFARPEHRRRLERLVDLQPEEVRAFDRQEISAAYLTRGREPQWATPPFSDPWAFYELENMAKRQIQFAEAEAELLAEEETPFGDTYVRPTPKVGRNEPCPCGSGKKYKNCCLGGA